MKRLASFVCAAVLAGGCTARPNTGASARAEGAAGDPSGAAADNSLAVLVTPDGHFLQFFEAGNAPGLVYVDETSPGGDPLISGDLLQLDALSLWSRLSPDPAPDLLVEAFRRGAELVDDPNEPLAATGSSEQPTSGGDSLLRTQAEVNWFVAHFCNLNPEMCLLYNWWAWSISPPTKWWDAASMNAYENPQWQAVLLNTWYWGQVPNNYGVYAWFQLGNTMLINAGWWGSRHVPQQSKKWQFKAEAQSSYEDPQLVGLRTAWGVDQPPPPPPNVPPCAVSIQIHTTSCWDVTGSPSNINFSTWGCGDTVQHAMDNAKKNLSNQTCLAESQTPGCCEYMFDDAVTGCQCN
jgi:hypothetical protein